MTTVEAPRGSILGTRVNRVEDPEFLTTGAVYTEDLVDDRLADAVRITVVRSPIAHARIASIDTSAAAAAPGCVAVYTAADLTDVPAQKTMLPMYPPEVAQPLLAVDTVRFVGEPVVDQVLGVDRAGGEELRILDPVDPGAEDAPARGLDGGHRRTTGSTVIAIPLDHQEGQEAVRRHVRIAPGSGLGSRSNPSTG